MAPATTQLQEEFGVGITQSLVSLSLYVFALALGPVLGGPLSETAGRHSTYTVLGTLGAFFTLGCGLVRGLRRAVRAALPGWALFRAVPGRVLWRAQACVQAEGEGSAVGFVHPDAFPGPGYSVGALLFRFDNCTA